MPQRLVHSSEFYVAEPLGPPVAAVVILHAFWGLTAFFKSICDRLAESGFIAIAPDLFEGETATTRTDAERIRKRRRREPAYRKVIRAAEWASRQTDGRPIGVIGFSYGGHWALWLVANPPVSIGAAVTFYAARNSAFHGTPIQAHFAESDEYVSQSVRQKFEKGLPPRSSVFHYAGTEHWFFETNQPTHDSGAADVAWSRALAFLRSELTRHPATTGQGGRSSELPVIREARPD